MLNDKTVVTKAAVDPGSVWVEQVIHATCRNCGKPLRKKPTIPGISGGIIWYHPHNSYKAHNGSECDPREN